MSNPFMARIAQALGIKVSNARLEAFNTVSVAQVLPAALAASTLPAHMRAAVMAVPPLTVEQIPERIKDAQTIADICHAAATSIKNPILNKLAPGYAMAGAQPEQVRRDLTDFLSDYSESVQISNAHPQGMQGMGMWDKTIERAKTDPNFARRGGVDNR